MASVLFFPTLPRSGSMLNGRVFQRQTLKLRTVANDCSSWPTARAEDAESCGGHRGAWDSLKAATERWPTPTVESGDQLDHGTPGTTGGTTLGGMARFLWKRPHGFQAGNGPDGNEFAKSVHAAWQTPSVADTLGGHARRGWKRSKELLLKGQAATWNTPTTKDGEKANDGPKAMARYGTPDMKTSDQRLRNQASAWATPTARDVKGCDMPHRVGTPSLPAQAITEAGKPGSVPAVLNPSFVETLMGFPLGWTVCDVSETPSSHSKQPSPSESSTSVSVAEEQPA